MRIIRAADGRVMPWKNGGGETREVLAEPDPADPAQFLWRISIATVAQAGPFSRFPGVDRTIAVLEGAGMRLEVDGEAVDLRPGGAPFRFAGEADVQAALVDGETTDLNVMTQRAAYSHDMRRMEVDGASVVTGAATQTLLVLNGPALLTGELATAVGRLDAVTGIGRGASVEICATEPCELFVVELHRP